MMNNDCLKEMQTYHRKKILLIFMQVLLLIIVLLTWELAATYKLIDEFIFSKPTAIIKILKKYIENQEIFKHIKISVYETILGIIIGSTAGIFIAALLWYFDTLAKILSPFLNVLNALPKTALAPIMIIWAGTGVTGIVVVAISILLIITILSAYTHFKNVEEDKIKMMKSFNATKLQIFTKLIFPSNIGNIASIIKINIGMAWIGVIVGEYIVSREGIGYLIMYGGTIFKMDLVMMGVLVLAVFAFGMYLIVEVIEKMIIKKRGEKK